MVNAQSNSGRPVCPACSKPTRICLCTRIRTPGLQNSVKVTILQHSLEKKHPLNSTRIAKLGLKNLTMATVSDVNFEARFVIRLLEPSSESLVANGLESLGCDRVLGCEGTHKLSFGHAENAIDSEFNQFGKGVNSKENNLSDCNGDCGKDTGSFSKCVIFEQNLALSTNDGSILQQTDQLVSKKCNSEKGTFDLETPHNHLVEESTLNEAILDEKSDIRPGFDRIQSDRKGGEEPVITATIGKYGVISFLNHSWIPETTNMNLASPGACDALAIGFVIKKLQMRQLDGSKELEEYEEFELEVPAGSVLLFPSEQAIGVDGLEDIHFKVKNLIVLDGTWAKAKRMYNENPWLKLLPHLKLDLDKISLYREVRHQPKAGYLSTIESIVHALKALGDNSAGLDNLLDVFEAMVGDQRRSKDERLSNVLLE